MFIELEVDSSSAPPGAIDQHVGSLDLPGVGQVDVGIITGRGPAFQNKATGEVYSTTWEHFIRAVADEVG